jgi:hypothetical protein
MASLVEDRMVVARAAIASTIAARTGMRFAGTPTATNEGDQDTYLTLCSMPPAGYHMEIELTPLELIMREVEGRREGEQQASRKITTADHLLEEINAFVHNRLLNPALPVQPLSPGLTDSATIDTVYGETLRRATFAGSAVAQSPRLDEAESLLFDDGVPTETLEKYRDYEKRVGDARADLREIATSGDDASRELAEQRLQRLEAEWIGIGRKREIEEAFRIIQEESVAAGFEDERVALLERFRAGEEKRIDLPGMTYHRVQIAPIAPLFSEESGGHWRRVDLDAGSVVSAISDDAKAVFGITDEQVRRAIDRLQSLSLEFITCDLVRDWIDTRFFTQRYWRLDPGETPLSDGVGGGRLPALPTKVVFIRNATVEYEGDWTARPGTLAEVSFEAPLQSTLQIAAELQPEKTAKSAQIMEAAKRRGLTSSISLLDREAKRVSAKTIRSAVAAAAPMKARSGEDNSGSVLAAARSGMIGSSANTIRMKSERPVSRESSGGARVRDDRDRDRPTTRRPSGGVRVRDHRDQDRPTTRESSGGARVRDHRERNRSTTRESSGGARVRDHRDPNRPTQPTNLTVKGTIEVPDEQKAVLDGISLHYTGEHRPDQEVAISLSRSSPTSRTFDHRFTSRIRTSSRPQRRYEIILRDADGDELDRRSLEIGDETEMTLNWVVRAEQMVIELAGQYTPTLHAWGLQPLPPCPDPDDTLEWP